MNRASVGIACILVVSLGQAVSDGFLHGDDPAQYKGAHPVLLADSGGNPWAVPDRRRQDGRLPSYITDPKYATKEDLKTELDYGNRQRTGNSIPAPQQAQPGYGTPPLGLPAVPNIYTPYTGAPYGYQPGYPMYPGMGVPGVGAPYLGDPGFGGNPLITPYGNIYGNVVPYQNQDNESSSGE